MQDVKRRLVHFLVAGAVLAICAAPVLSQSTDPEDPACTDPNGDSCYLAGNDIHVAFPHSPILILLFGTLALFIFVRIVTAIWQLVAI